MRNAACLFINTSDPLFCAAASLNLNSQVIVKELERVKVLLDRLSLELVNFLSAPSSLCVGLDMLYVSS